MQNGIQTEEQKHDPSSLLVNRIAEIASARDTEMPPVPSHTPSQPISDQTARVMWRYIAQLNGLQVQMATLKEQHQKLYAAFTAEMERCRAGEGVQESWSLDVEQERWQAPAKE